MSAHLFTIGHSTHDTEYFIGLLKKHRIKAVCDVRSMPYSRYNPQYNREEIAKVIKGHEMRYVYLGRELGARSDNPDIYVNGKIQFNKLADEPLFQQGLERLRTGAGKYRIALMCAEKDPIVCHRTILVARQLRREFTIKHILEDGGIESNEAAEKRLQKLLNIRPAPITDDENQCIELAYNLQGRKIAYVKEGQPRP